MEKYGIRRFGETEFDFMKSFAIYHSLCDNELARDQFRVLWTTYCLHQNMEPDTRSYDNDLLRLWYHIVNCDDAETEDWSDYDSFDMFMCAYLC